MSNLVAHTAVAKAILEKRPNLVQNRRAYYLGALAPDTIMGVPGTTKEDKKRVHLREGIQDDQWFQPDQMEIFRKRVQEFIDRYITNETDGAQRDFNMGFVVHALTDKCNHGLILPKVFKIVKEQGIGFNTNEFGDMCVNDLEAYDKYLLEKDPEIRAIIEELNSRESEYGLAGWIEKEYISGAMWWWTNKYLLDIEKREVLYITTEDFDEFIPYCVEKILEELKA